MIQPRSTPRRSTRYLAAALAALLAGPLVAARAAFAGDDDPATSNLMSGGITIPYEGYLMLDNAPMTGTRAVRFDLWGDPSDASASSLRYAETQTITLFNGLFTAAIGTGAQIGARTLSQAVLDGDRLYLSISVEDGAGNLVPLTGRQAIEAAPFSAWTGNAANMSVAGTLTVGGNIVAPAAVLTVGSVNMSGPLTSGNISSNASLQVQANVSAGGIVSAARVQTTGDVVATGAVRGSLLAVTGNVGGGSLSVSGAASVQSLSVTSGAATVGNLSIVNAPGAPGTRIDSNGAIALFPSGSDATVHVAGDFRVTGNTHNPSTCGWTSWVRKISSFSSSTPPSSATTNYNLNSCPDGRFVAGMDFSHHSGNDLTFDEYYRLYCCDL